MWVLSTFHRMRAPVRFLDLDRFSQNPSVKIHQAAFRMLTGRRLGHLYLDPFDEPMATTRATANRFQVMRSSRNRQGRWVEVARVETFPSL